MKKADIKKQKYAQKIKQQRKKTTDPSRSILMGTESLNTLTQSNNLNQSTYDKE